MRGRNIGSILLAMLFLFPLTACASSKEIRYGGKVIDFDTKEPIEGAVVIAFWFNLAGDPFIREVKEALTDKDGDWSIVGERGKGSRRHPIPSLDKLIGLDTSQPQFILFKPGYESFYGPKGESYSFLAYPYEDKKLGFEGIILMIPEKEEKYMEKRFQSPPINPLKAYGLPFIALKDPERKLRTLKIPFDYPSNMERLNIERPGFLDKYTILGFKRLETRKDRARALIVSHPIISDSDEPSRQKELLRKQSHFLRLFEEENRYLGLDFYRRYKEILEK